MRREFPISFFRQTPVSHDRHRIHRSPAKVEEGRENGILAVQERRERLV